MSSRLLVASQSAATARHALNVLRPREPVFLVSHMRSYSSLLCHLLNSNPQIDGYGELGIDYRSLLDLIAMRNKIVGTIGRPLSGRYTLDKLLHPRLDIADQVLRAPTTHVMIGIRNPEASVRSIITMGRRRRRPDWKRRPREAARYYIDRSRAFRALVKRRADVLVFPADAVIDDTERFLSGMTDWLGLKTPLQPNYELGAMTGRSRFGDNTAQIRTGVINRDRPVSEIEIPEPVKDRIWTAYDRTLDVLFEHAEHVLCPESRAKRGS